MSGGTVTTEASKKQFDAAVVFSYFIDFTNSKPHGDAENKDRNRRNHGHKHEKRVEKGYNEAHKNCNGQRDHNRVKFGTADSLSNLEKIG